MCFSTALSPQIVRKISEDSVDGGPRALVVVGPEVAVGVEGLARAGVAQTGLNCLDGLAVADEQRGVVVAQLVEADGRHAGLLECAVPLGPEGGSAQGGADVVGEDQRVRGVGAQVIPQGVYDHSRERDDPQAGLGLRWPEEGLATVDIDELPVDEDRAALEVEAVDGEAEDLALAQAGAGG